MGMEKIGCTIFQIYARSPDLNPIENMFEFVRKKLGKDTIDRDITKETFQEFSQHVRKTIKKFPLDFIDWVMAAMNKRIIKIAANGRWPTKY